MTIEEVRNRIQNATGVPADLLFMVKKRVLGHDEDNSAGVKKERKTEEEMGR